MEFNWIGPWNDNLISSIILFLSLCIYILISVLVFLHVFVWMFGRSWLCSIFTQILNMLKADRLFDIGGPNAVLKNRATSSTPRRELIRILHRMVCWHIRESTRRIYWFVRKNLHPCKITYFSTAPLPEILLNKQDQNYHLFSAFYLRILKIFKFYLIPPPPPTKKNIPS